VQLSRCVETSTLDSNVGNGWQDIALKINTKNNVLVMKGAKIPQNISHKFHTSALVLLIVFALADWLGGKAQKFYYVCILFYSVELLNYNQNKAV
jgi:hypothetical protein